MPTMLRNAMEPNLAAPFSLGAIFPARLAGSLERPPPTLRGDGSGGSIWGVSAGSALGRAQWSAFQQRRREASCACRLESSTLLTRALCFDSAKPSPRTAP